MGYQGSQGAMRADQSKGRASEALLLLPLTTEALFPSSVVPNLIGQEVWGGSNGSRSITPDF